MMSASPVSTTVRLLVVATPNPLTTATASAPVACTRLATSTVSTSAVSPLVTVTTTLTLVPLRTTTNTVSTTDTVMTAMATPISTTGAPRADGAPTAGLTTRL